METLNKDTQTAMTPQAALERLMEGNRRFRERGMVARDLPQQVKETSGGQFPSAVVLTCIDSRTPPELLFDQGLGDVFSVRIAGNIVNEDILGSMEFACKLAGSKVILVLGHTHCGAVKGACDGARLGNLTALMNKLEPVVEKVRGSWSDGETNSGNAAFVQSVVHDNVHAVVEQIRERSDTLREMADSGAIQVIGGVYDVETGGVELLQGEV